MHMLSMAWFAMGLAATRRRVAEARLLPQKKQRADERFALGEKAQRLTALEISPTH